MSVLLVLTGCKDKAAPKTEAPSPAPTTAEATPKPRPPTAQRSAPKKGEDPRLDEYVEDIIAFTPEPDTYESVRARMAEGSLPLKKEWESWEAKGKMTEARIKEFYKQTTNYIYELGEWHLNDPLKRVSDDQMITNLKEMKPKNILDFGGGVGMVAIPLARAGFDVTLADLDGTSLTFAASRAKRHEDTLKIWKVDVEPMPADKKYDVILALDVLEHLPPKEMKEAVDKLVRLKHKDTKVIMSAPFGRTATHPMHLDADDHTKKQVERFKTEFTP